MKSAIYRQNSLSGWVRANLGFGRISRARYLSTKLTNPITNHTKKSDRPPKRKGDRFYHLTQFRAPRI
jgi:hypothetical protein